MTAVHIHYELIARLMRQGDGELINAGLPHIEQIVGGSGALAQQGRWVPELDSIRAIMATSRALREVSGATAEHAVGVDREALQALLIGMVRMEPQQRSIEGTERPFKQIVREERELLKSCQAKARTLAERLQAKQAPSFEAYQKLSEDTPDQQRTIGFLSLAGKSGLSLLDDKGAPSPIMPTIPSTLAASTPVELLARVHCVDDRTCKALIDPAEPLNDTAKSILAHHPKMIELEFNGDSTERADLTAAQYLNVPLRIRAGAECAVLPQAKKKSRLILIEVLESRDIMDELHRTASQIGLKLHPE